MAKSRRKSSAPTPPPVKLSRERGVISLDTPSIRAQALKQCKKAHDAYEKARAELEQWEKVEYPAAREWAMTQNAGLAAQLQAAEDELERKRSLLLRILDKGFMTTKSPGQCYDEAMRDASRESSGEGRAEGEEEEDKEDPIRDFFDDLFGDDGDDEDDEEEEEHEFKDFFSKGGKRGSRGRAKSAPAKEDAKTQDIRTLYRNLCRELHPDGGGEFDERRRDLFHQVQEAYEHRDLARLEHLASVVENGGDVPVKASRVEIILRALRRFTDLTQELRKSLREAKRSPGWGFFSWTPATREKKARAIRAEGQEDLALLKADIRAIDRDLDFYRRDSEKRKARAAAHQARPRKRPRA